MVCLKKYQFCRINIFKVVWQSSTTGRTERDIKLLQVSEYRPSPAHTDL
jgi:hypothetical protein